MWIVTLLPRSRIASAVFAGMVLVAGLAIGFSAVREYLRVGPAPTHMTVAEAVARAGRIRARLWPMAVDPPRRSHAPEASPRSLPKTIDVTIPSGVRDGSVIRLAGQGGAAAGGEPGDLYLHVRIRPHPVFRVKGDDLEVDLPVAPWEAVLGARVEVPTIDGRAEVTIPRGAQAGQRLRLRGQGLNRRGGGRGDEYARLKIVVPRKVGDAERELYEELKRVSDFDPRDDARRAKGAA
jgi:hypothetical protein